MGGGQSSGKRKKKRPAGAAKSDLEKDLARQSGFDLFDDEADEPEEIDEDTDEEPVARSVAPPSQLLCLDIQSTVELTVRCEGLPSSRPTFVVIYSKWAKDTDWVEIGMTETNSKKDLRPTVQEDLFVGVPCGDDA